MRYNSILTPVALAQMPQDEWEIQIEVWENNHEITQHQAKTLLRMVQQWQQTGCPLTFGEEAA